MKEKISKLNETQKKLRLLSTIFIVSAILCIVLLFKNPPFACGMFVVLMLFYIFYFKRGTRKYEQSVKEAIIEEGLRFAFRKISYKAKNGVSGEVIAGAEFVPAEHVSQMVVRDTVQGVYQGMAAFLTDITTDYETNVSDSRGKTRKVQDHLSGCYYEVQLPRDQGPEFILWPKASMTDAAREIYFAGKRKLPVTEKGAGGFLPEYYLIYGSGEGGEPVITDEFVRMFKELAQFTPGLAAVQVAGNHMRVFLQNRFLYTAALPIKLEITSKLLTMNPFPEMNYLLRLADVLIK